MSKRMKLQQQMNINRCLALTLVPAFLAGNGRTNPFPDKVWQPGTLSLSSGYDVHDVITLIAPSLNRKPLASAAYPTNRIYLYCAEGITKREFVKIVKNAMRFHGVEPVLVGDMLIMARTIPQ